MNSVTHVSSSMWVSLIHLWVTLQDFFLDVPFIGVLHKIFHSNLCTTWLFISLAGSDLWVGLSCSLQRVIQFFSFHQHNLRMFTFSILNFARWAQIFIFQWKQRTNFSCFPTNCNSEIHVGKLMKLFNEVLRFVLILFTIW